MRDIILALGMIGFVILCGIADNIQQGEAWAFMYALALVLLAYLTEEKEGV